MNNNITFESLDLKDCRSKLESKLTLEALRQSSWNLTEASEILGVSRATVYHYIDKYDLPRRDLTLPHAHAVRRRRRLQRPIQP